MGNEEAKEAVEKNAGEMKAGEPGSGTAIQGSELIRKLSYDELSVDAAVIVQTLKKAAKAGNIPSLKVLMEYADEYVRRVGAPVSRESLGQLLIKALENEGEGEQRAAAAE